MSRDLEGEARQRAANALIAAATNTRSGMWINAAPSHVIIEVLTALEADGWQLVRAREFEQAQPSEAKAASCAGIAHSVRWMPVTQLPSVSTSARVIVGSEGREAGARKLWLYLGFGLRRFQDDDGNDLDWSELREKDRSIYLLAFDAALTAARSVPVEQNSIEDSRGDSGRPVDASGLTEDEKTRLGGHMDDYFGPLHDAPIGEKTYEAGYLAAVADGNRVDPSKQEEG